MVKVEEREMICISCPIGCNLKVKIEKGEDTENIIVEGNKCPRGEVYGKEEILSPKRVVTATVKLNSNYLKRLPVKTDKPIEKQFISELLNRLYSIEIKPPVKIGDIIIKNYKNTGVNIVATTGIDK